MKSAIRIFLCFIFLFIFGCNDNSVGNENLNETEITGKLVNRSNLTLNENMKVVILWIVSSGSPDYTYVWGEGNIDINNMSFRITFDENPPSEAINIGTLGVGLICLVEDSELQEGILSSNYPSDNVHGISEKFAIVFKIKNYEDDNDHWLNSFQNGYTPAKGVEVENGFDYYLPTGDEEIEIIIDNLVNLNIIDWT